MTMPQRVEAMLRKAKSEDYSALGVRFEKEFLNAMKALADNKLAVYTEGATDNKVQKPPKECFGCHPDLVESIYEVVQCEDDRYYVVDWKLRANGFQPLRSFISENDMTA